MNHDQAPDEPAGRRHLATRAVLLALCLLLSLEALAGYLRWRANQARLSAILSEYASREIKSGAGSEEGERAGAVLRRVSFERTPHHAKLAVARVLVYEVLAGGRPASARLAHARELALEVLRQQPNNWQASMFLGAATYLDWSTRSDRRLFTAAARWQQPLLEALAAAPGQPEPRRFLAAAYLENWAALSAARKAFAGELVKTMFRRDPSSFDHLGPIWFEVAGESADAQEVIPDLPRPWLILERSFAEKQDWASFCLAHDRYSGALRRQLCRHLDEAQQRRRLGDLSHSRQMCLSVVVSCPLDGRFADLVSRAFEIYPPGLHGLRSKAALDKWLRWALELNAIGLDPFSPRVINRLTDAAGTLDPPTGAMAALIASEVYHVGRYERLADSKRSKEWAPFLIAKSRWLIDREDLGSASEALGEVHRSSRSSASYWLARRRLARATGALSDLATAEEQLAGIRSRQWRALDWRWRGRRAVLELQAEIAAPGLSITVNKAPEGGAVAELLWDGSVVALRPVAAGRTIELAIEIEPGPHLLELRSLAGGEIYPGAVELLVEPGGPVAAGLKARAMKGVPAGLGG